MIPARPCPHASASPSPARRSARSGRGVRVVLAVLGPLAGPAGCLPLWPAAPRPALRPEPSAAARLVRQLGHRDGWAVA